MTPGPSKKVLVSKAALKKAGVRSTKASAALSGRFVPAGHRRSTAVQAYLDEQGPLRLRE